MLKINLLDGRMQQKKFNIDFFITADGDDLFCSKELIDLAFKSEFIQ